LWRLAATIFGCCGFAANNPSRPGWLIPAVIALTLYALSPLNLVIPVLAWSMTLSRWCFTGC
jgi:hypothetical protein